MTMLEECLGLGRLARPYEVSNKGGDWLEIRADQLGGKCRITGTAERVLENLPAEFLLN